MKLADGVYFIEGKSAGRFPYSNSLLVENILIDSGCGTEKLEEIMDRFEVLVLSHNHPDHASGAWYAEKFGKTIFTPHPSTKVKELAKRFAYEIADEWMDFAMNVVGLRDFSGILYDINHEFQTKNHEIELVKTEGHTADMHLFLIDSKILFSADIDLTPFGPWYGNPESDPEKFRRSIEKLFDYDFDIIVPSHREPVEGRENIEALLTEYLEHFDRREDKIRELMEKGYSLDEMVKISPIYGGRKPTRKSVLDYFERNMIKKHIEKIAVNTHLP